jgi:MFS family permease
MGFAANCILNLNITQSQVLGALPYNFTPSAVGLVNLASVGGAAIGLLTAGPLSDRVSMKITKRDRGMREPERRLPALLPYIAACLVGNTVHSASHVEMRYADLIPFFRRS